MNLVVHYFFNGGIFIDDNFDTASNWDGDQTANKSKSVHTDDDGNKNNDWREAKTFTLNTWSDNVIFDLLIDEIKEEEAESRPWKVDEKKNGVDNTGDNWSKHGDKIEEEGDKS